MLLENGCHTLEFLFENGCVVQLTKVGATTGESRLDVLGARFYQCTNVTRANVPPIKRFFSRFSFGGGGVGLVIWTGMALSVTRRKQPR